MKVRFNRGALRDLEEIFEYVSADNPRAAAALVARIEKATALIGDIPNWREDQQATGSKISCRQLSDCL